MKVINKINGCERTLTKVTVAVLAVTSGVWWTCAVARHVRADVVHDLACG